MQHGQRRLRAAGALALLVSVLATLPLLADTAPEQEPFPGYPAIQGNVEFWTRVFGEWTMGQVAVHDLEYPAVVYEVVDLPGNIEDRYTDEQKDFTEQLKERWQVWLLALENKVDAGEALDDLERQWVEHLTEKIGPDAVTGAHDRVRTQRGIRERFRAGLERSYRYDEMIRGIFRAKGLPEDLAYLPHVESSFRGDARSSAGATGLWQFTRGTGRRYLKVTSTVDERMDPIAATRGAADYLADAYVSLKSWPLALTSYNHGVQGMLRAKKRFGPDYETIFREYDGRSFGFASKNFYAEFLAAMRIARDPDAYFPEGYAAQPALDLDRFVLKSKATPGRISRMYGVPVSELAALNPAWSRRTVRRGHSLPAGLEVWLPSGTLERSADGSGSTAADTPGGWIDDAGYYIVQRGDTLSGIASGYRISLAELRRWNSLPPGSSLIHVGQKLRLDADTGARVHVVRRGETLSGIAHRYGIRTQQLREANRIPAGDSLIRAGQRLRLPPQARSLSRVHVVQRGETLLHIAGRYGIRLTDLLSANSLNIRSIIYPGQSLDVPTR